uniref:Uncharacterized protein n=1 Tax=Arundo donax TaxID=35708 RepID=A0A0A9DFE2_ARUDO
MRPPQLPIDGGLTCIRPRRQRALRRRAWPRESLLPPPVLPFPPPRQPPIPWCARFRHSCHSPRTGPVQWRSAELMEQTYSCFWCRRFAG